MNELTPEAPCPAAEGEIENRWYTMSMHWVERNGKRYAYQSRLVEGKCVKTYVGTGVKAAEAERKDIEASIARTAAHQNWLCEWSRIDSVSQPLEALCDQGKLLTHAVLILAGFYLHKGHEWRIRSKRDA